MAGSAEAAAGGAATARALPRGDCRRGAFWQTDQTGWKQKRPRRERVRSLRARALRMRQRRCCIAWSVGTVGQHVGGTTRDWQRCASKGAAGAGGTRSSCTLGGRQSTIAGRRESGAVAVNCSAPGLPGFEAARYWGSS